MRIYNSLRLRLRPYSDRAAAFFDAGPAPDSAAVLPSAAFTSGHTPLPSMIPAFSSSPNRTANVEYPMLCGGFTATLSGASPCMWYGRACCSAGSPRLRWKVSSPGANA